MIRIRNAQLIFMLTLSIALLFLFSIVAGEEVFSEEDVVEESDDSFSLRVLKMISFGVISLADDPSSGGIIQKDNFSCFLVLFALFVACCFYGKKWVR